MKKEVQILLYACVILLGAAQAVTAQGRLVFSREEHYFGSFPQDAGPQTCVFEFTNQGNAPLFLLDVKPDCGCTTPEYTQAAVPVGGKGYIKVTYDPEKQTGVFSKKIRVMAQAIPGMLDLFISGEVLPPRPAAATQQPLLDQIGPLRLQSRHRNFGTVRVNQILADTFEVVNSSTQPVRLTFQPPATIPRVTVTAMPATLRPNERGKIALLYDTRNINTYGYCISRIYVIINGQQDTQNFITITATLQEDFSALTPTELEQSPVAQFTENTYDFGTIREGVSVSHNFVLKNGGQRELIIRNIKTACDCTRATPQKMVIAPGESIPVTVSFDSTGKHGRQSRTISIITNDPKNAASILTIIVTVR
ncbi:MAG: DUF1573 domain-containing protein [Bacteroidales bacterium]|jgi:hypothetical protein|nr:DUF1573 domain-containing protein [Bacteroidales bacterium]